MQDRDEKRLERVSGSKLGGGGEASSFRLNKARKGSNRIINTDANCESGTSRFFVYGCDRIASRHRYAKGTIFLLYLREICVRLRFRKLSRETTTNVKTYTL